MHSTSLNSELDTRAAVAGCLHHSYARQRETQAGRALCTVCQLGAPLLVPAAGVSSLSSTSYSTPEQSCRGVHSRPSVVWVLFNSWGAAKAAG